LGFATLPPYALPRLPMRELYDRHCEHFADADPKQRREIERGEQLRIRR
jgi:hypothetical protein